MANYGPFIARSEIGCTSQKSKNQPSLVKNMAGSKLLFISLFFLSHYSFTFAAITKEIVIASHNLHGFKTSIDYHKSCLQTHGGIWMGQEHWLSERQLPLLQKVDTQFVARSGMEEAISTGILKGRPFGGVSIAWSSDLNNVIKPITSYKHKRLVAVELVSVDLKILFISVYMPFFDSSKRQKCLTETVDALSMIELLIDDFPNHLVVIGGDLNTELKGESPFDPFKMDKESYARP